MFKVKLSIGERIKLSEQIGAEQSSYARLKMISVFRESLSLSEDEQMNVGFTETMAPNGMMHSHWAHPEKDPMKKFEIGEILTEIICTKLKGLNDTNKLTNDVIPLYESFKLEIDKIDAVEPELADESIIYPDDGEYVEPVE